jgi:hypothetical protein
MMSADSGLPAPAELSLGCALAANGAAAAAAHMIKAANQRRGAGIIEIRKWRLRSRERAAAERRS